LSNPGLLVPLSNTLSAALLTYRCVPCNYQPVISAASISPTAPFTTQALIASATATDPEGDSIAFSYQWQQSTNNLSFTDLAVTYSNTLPSAVTVSGDYYRVVHHSQRRPDQRLAIYHHVLCS